MERYSNGQIKSALKDLSGQVINGFEFISPEIYGKNLKTKWKVRCPKCFETVVRRTDAILAGKVKSCGCCKNIQPKKYTIEERYVVDFYRTYERVATAIKNTEWEVSVPLFLELISSDCIYCGNPPETRVAHKKYSDQASVVYFNGIDRIDSSIGYIEGNIVSCCSMCNRMKMDYQVGDFIRKCIQIASIWRTLNAD